MSLHTLLGRTHFAAFVLTISLTQGGVLAAAQVPSGKPQAAQQSNYRIAGAIVNALTGEPLGRARVTLTNTRNSKQNPHVVTADDGRFEFTGLAAGKFNLRGAKRGFEAADYDQHETFSTAIVTGAGVDTENLRLQLQPLAFLTGKVLDESGEPVHQANVVLYRRFTTGGLVRTSRVSQDSTDDQGYFEFPAMLPGDYFVGASGKPWYAVHPRLSPGEGAKTAPTSVPQSLDVTYPAIYYDGASDSDGATLLPVKAGDHLRIEIHLIPAPSLHLIFRTPEGATAFGPPTFQRRVFDTTENLQNVQMQWISAGVWEVSGVSVGRYTIVEQVPGGQKSGEVSLAQDGQEMDLSRSEASAQVTLHTKLPTDETRPSQIFLALRNSQRRVVANRAADASGTATFQNVVPGRYSILAGSSSGRYSVTRMSSPAGELSGHEVDIQAGASVDLTVFLTAGVVDVEGIVKRGDKPAAGIMVALVPKDPEAHIELFRRDQSDLDGSFTVTNIIPGPYTIIAVEDAWGFPWLQEGILARYLPKGQTLNITENMKRSVYLPEPLQVQPR